MILCNMNIIALARSANMIRRCFIAAIRIGVQVIAAFFVFLAMCVSVIIQALREIEDE